MEGFLNIMRGIETPLKDAWADGNGTYAYRVPELLVQLKLLRVAHYDEMGQVRALANEAHSEAHERAMREERKRHNDEMAVLRQSHEKDMQALKDSFEAIKEKIKKEAYDPQRIRGTKPDTFDGALEALREYRWQHATNDTDAIPYVNKLAKMHVREIEHERKAEYKRGYEDGLKARDVGMWQLEHERMKAVANLANAGMTTGNAIKKLSDAIGCEWNPQSVSKCIARMQNRLIYLLGGCNLFETRKIRDIEDEPTLQKATNFTNADTSIEPINDYADLVAERDGILNLLRDAAKDYKELLDNYLAAPWDAMQPMDNEHMSKLGWMRALDRDGVPICMGDTVRYDKKDVPFVGEPFEVAQITHFRDGSCYVSGGCVSVSAKSVQCTHQEPKPDPIEQVIRDLTLGNMTETEAIERLHEISGS